MVNSFQEIRVETNLFPDYILDDTSDNDNLNGDKSINDMDDDENYINDNNRNNDCNHPNDHNDDDNDNNFDNDNGDQIIRILQAMHFREPFVCDKAGFCESAQTLMCLHSVNPCLIYMGELRFMKNHRNGSSISSYKTDGWELIHTGIGGVGTAFP